MARRARRAGAGIAYALGREAVSAQLSVMELAEAHHRATRDALRERTSADARAAVLDAGAAFLREALSTFDIAHRGYHEMQQVARLEHEYVMQLRALADASVAHQLALTTEEILQHTADAAREVLGVRHATVPSTAGDPFARAAQRHGAARRRGRSADLGSPARRRARAARAPRSAMLEVRDVADRRFSARDEAILAQLGQLAVGGDREVAGSTRASATSRTSSSASCCRRRCPTFAGLGRRRALLAAGEGIEVGGDFYDFFAAAPRRLRGADRRRLRQGPRGRRRHLARPPHAARRGGLRAAAERRARAAAPRPARRTRRRPLLHRRLRRAGAAPRAARA